MLGFLLAAQLVVTFSAGEGFAPPPYVRLEGKGPNGAQLTVERVVATGSWVTLAPGTWHLTCQAPGYWPYRKTLLVQGREHLSCLMVPLARLVGTLQPPAGTPPSPVVLRLLSPQGDAEGEPLPCTQQAERVSCEAPAGTHSLRLRAAGFVSLFYWDLTLLPHKVRDLGTIRLQPGASLTGWVSTAKAKVLARPEPLGEGPQLKRGVVSALANDKGFFHLAGLAPGRYRLWAEGAKARSQPLMVVVQEGQETHLPRPLELIPPVTAVIFLSPPRGEEEKPWQVTVLQHDPARAMGEVVAQVQADETGRAEVPDILPGRYVVLVRGSKGETAYGGKEELGEAPLHLSLAGVRVRGVVKLGDEPVVGELFFGGEASSGAKVCPTNAKGEFSCTLPWEGPWAVTVRGGGLIRNLTVEVRASKQKKEAFLELQFPPTELRGKVVTPEGQAPSFAILNMKHPQQPLSQLLLRGQSEFVVKGLDPGNWLVYAENAQAASERLLVPMAEGQRPPELLLTLRPLSHLQGRVVRAGTGLGLAGARLFVVPLPQNSFSLPSEFTSEAEGRFELALPQLPALALAVEAPGFARRWFSFASWPEQEVVLPVDEQGGTLLLGFARKAMQRLAVVSEGILEGIAALEQWARAQGEEPEDRGELVRLRVPRLAPGRYGLCAQIEWAGTAWQGSGCVWGQLAAGGQLALSLEP